MRTKEEILKEYKETIDVGKEMRRHSNLCDFIPFGDVLLGNPNKFYINLMMNIWASNEVNNELLFDIRELLSKTTPTHPNH